MKPLGLLDLLFGLCLALACCSASRAACYSDKLPGPAVRQQTLVLIDLTTAKDPVALESFRRAMDTLLRQPGQRIVVSTFAGLGDGESLHHGLPRTIEQPIVDKRLADSLPIRGFLASQECVRKTIREIPPLALADVQAALGKLDPDVHRQSEIVYSLHRALARLARPGLSTRVVVFSDALEHAFAGLSFYDAKGRPRLIDPVAELRNLPPELAAPPARAMGPVRVLWWGLLAHDGKAGSANGRHYKAAVPLQLEAFWAALMQRWGALDLQFNPVSLQEDASFAPLDAGEMAVTTSLAARPLARAKSSYP